MKRIFRGKSNLGAGKPQEPAERKIKANWAEPGLFIGHRKGKVSQINRIDQCEKIRQQGDKEKE
jgi:hypothetical protein